jgi:hypothetical protein
MLTRTPYGQSQSRDGHRVGHMLLAIGRQLNILTVQKLGLANRADEAEDQF